MHPQSTAVAVSQHLEIATSLRRFHNAECVFLAGYGKVRGVVAGNLQKYSGVRSALVRLSGGMQKPGTKSEAGRDFFLVPDRMTDFLQLRLMCIVALDVG